MLLASGPDEAPELVTARHTPPTTPEQEPSPCEPRGFGDTDGSVAVAALVTFPVHAPWPSHSRDAPAAEAADGPAGSRARFVFSCGPASPACGAGENASAAPGPVEAFDTDCTSQAPVPLVQPAEPCEVRGLPPATAPSHALVLVRTVPWQAVPASQARLADEDEVDDGPASDWPGSGFPVAGSTATWSGALEAAEAVSPEQPPPVTVQSAVDEVPRACGDTPVSRALVDELVVPPHGVDAPEQETDPVAFDTLTGPDTAATPSAAAFSAAEAGSRSATVVSAPAPQLPPSPRTEHVEVAVLSRTPFTSPDAAPDVVALPAPVHAVLAQSACAFAVLVAVSS